MNFPSQNLNIRPVPRNFVQQTLRNILFKQITMLCFLNMVYSAFYGSDIVYSQLILTKTSHLFMENNLNKIIN